MNERSYQTAEQRREPGLGWVQIRDSASLWFASKFLGLSMTQALQTMKRVQWLSTDELLARSETKLAKVLQHTATRVPFYRDLFSNKTLDLGNSSTFEILKQFPVITKGRYKENPLEYFLADNIPSERRLLWTTSGSTGEPFSFYLDRRAMPQAFANHLFFDSWWGLRPFERYVRIVNPPAAPPRLPAEISAGSRVRWKIANSLKKAYESLTQEKIWVMEVDRDQAEQIYRRIERFRPSFILGYTSTLAFIAHELIERQMWLAHPVQGVITIAETLSPQRREIIEKYFKAPIINRYGLREFATWSAQSCSSSPNELHINTEMVVCEIVRADGSPAPVGETGRVVLTDLHNYARPFIRYDTGDLGVAGSGSCACGRGFPLLHRLDGRSLECIVTKAGKEISPLVLGRYLRDGGPSFLYNNHQEFIKQFQLIQETPTSALMLIVVSNGFDDDMKERLRSDLGRLLGDEMSVAVKVVDEIQCESSGKRPIIKVIQR